MKVPSLRSLSGTVQEDVKLKSVETTFGRSPQCDIRVLDKRISATHFRLFLGTDSGSNSVEADVEVCGSNGLWVNRKRLKTNSKQKLQAGDVIDLVKYQDSTHRIAFRFEPPATKDVVLAGAPAAASSPVVKPQQSTPTESTPLLDPQVEELRKKLQDHMKDRNVNSVNEQRRKRRHSKASDYLESGTVLNARWEVRNSIGQGTFSRIFSAVDLDTNKEVAVKVEKKKCFFNAVEMGK
mmetsp:Transcript_34483/g.67881  ORF Transcript_34483/g.67881 Transcript_34483/m.67881 type:complete len:238 (-) Transcript_34483:1655-2368(-)